MSDPLKHHIVGFRRGGKTCPCCVEFKDKQVSRRVARRRLKPETREEVREALADEVDREA